MFIETRKKKREPQKKKTIALISTLEKLQSLYEDGDAWDYVNSDEHPGRVRLKGRGITKSMLKGKENIVGDPCEQVPESLVQAITEKVAARQKEELTKRFEAEKENLIQGLAEFFTEAVGKPINPDAIAKLMARTRPPDEAGSAPNNVTPRSSESTHDPQYKENN